MKYKILSKVFSVFLSSLVFLSISYKYSFSNDGPTLLKKSDKKEKLREEDLVTKEVDVNNLEISKYINIELVKSIFPEADDFGKVEEKTLSIPIYKDHKEIGFLFETLDKTILQSSR